MRTISVVVVLLAAGLAAASAAAVWWPVAPAERLAQPEGDIKRGAYLARLAGCVACHTSDEGDPFAGGVVLESPFGNFVSPNITPHPDAGIGDWTRAEFARAVRSGISPDGEAYYPAFPYEFYSEMTDRDIADLWVALKSLPAVSGDAPDHDVGFPFDRREGLKVWRPLFEQSYDHQPEADRSVSWNRGKYIVEGVAHCGACHIPRNFAGGLDRDAGLLGNSELMGGPRAPALSAARLRANGWTHQNLVGALRTGILPDGDVFGGAMAEVVNESTSYLMDQHVEDIATYLLGDE